MYLSLPSCFIIWSGNSMALDENLLYCKELHFFFLQDLCVRDLCCRQKKSRFNAYELYSTANCLCLLLTWGQHFRLIRLGRWNKETFLTLNLVIWLAFLLMLPQLTREPWRGIMLVFILKNRFRGRIYLRQRDSNNSWYIAFKTST